MFQGSQSHKMSEWLSRGLHHLPQITSLWKNQFYSLLNFKHLPFQSSGITLLRAKPEIDDSKDLLLGLWNICCKNLERTYKSLQKTLSKENMHQQFKIIWQKVSRLICWVSNNLLFWHTRKLNSSQSNRTRKCYQETPPPCRPGNSHVQGFLLMQREFCKVELMRIKL